MKRVVTGHNNNGKAIFSIEESPNCTIEPVPGWKFIELWGTDDTCSLPDSSDDPTTNINSLIPNIGGSRFRIFTVPPGAENEVVREKLKLAIPQIAHLLPGMGEHLEVDNPGMHTTDTIDYVIAISGEAYLELDDGVETHITPGDCIVQRGTRHAWRNKGKENFVAACVMIGADRKSDKG